MSPEELHHLTEVAISRGAVDRRGVKYNRLTALKPVARSNGGVIRWLCQCDCGTYTVVNGNALTTDATKSCGCLCREQSVKQCKSRTVHGMHNTPTYSSWKAMKNRCLRTKDINFHRYGGRGIKVCSQWLDSFSNFLDDMGVRPEGTSIDRIDPDGNYEPSNVRWATRKQQQNNLRSNRLITHEGETLTITQWARKTGIRRDTIAHRLKAGWLVSVALETPVEGAK